MRKSLLPKKGKVEKGFWGLVAGKAASMVAGKGAAAGAATQGADAAAAGGTADAGGDMMGMAKNVPQPPWNLAKPLGQGIGKAFGADEGESEAIGDGADLVAGGARMSTDPVGGGIQMAKAVYNLNSSLAGKEEKDTAYGKFSANKKFAEDSDFAKMLIPGFGQANMIKTVFGGNKKANAKRKKEMEDKITRARFSALDAEKQDDYNTYSAMGQNAMMMAKEGGSLLPKKLYRSDRTFNGDDYSRVWTKRPGTILAKKGLKIGQGGMRLQDIYVDQRPPVNNGNSFEQINITGGQERDTMSMLRGRMQQKSGPTRKMRNPDGQELDPDNAQKFEKGGKAGEAGDCGCMKGEDGIDTDIFKSFSPKAINSMRRALGMGGGLYTDKVKENLKVASAKQGMKLVDFVTALGSDIKEELQIVSAKQGAVLKKKSPPLFQQGGTLAKENKILNGTFHSRRNEVAKNLEGAEITKKGIPVISEECDDEGCEVVQHAEVEKNELVFSKENTQVIEQYIQKVEEVGEDQSRELYMELGQWLQSQLLENTEDSKDKLLK